MSVKTTDCYENCYCTWGPAMKIKTSFCKQYICFEMVGEKWPEFLSFANMRGISKLGNYAVKPSGLSVTTNQFSQPLKAHKMILWEYLF